jgi:hypothetical protein
MNQMAKDLDQTMEYLANTTFETLKDVCDVQADINSTQAGQVTCLQDETQNGVDALIAAGGGGGGAGTKFFVGPYMPDGGTGGDGISYNGQCCGWDMPDGTKELKIELYGAGASGYGGCCCMMNPLPGGSGAYAVRILKKDDGDFLGNGTETYHFCGGGTGCCWNGSHGNRGHTSHATGPGLANFCALGGHPGEHHCQNWNCYTCCNTCYGCASFCGADYGQTGRSGWRKSSQHCASDMYQVAPGAPGPLGKGDRWSNGSCVFGYHTTGTGTPGSGALGAATSGSCCCATAGGAGLVVVTYW